MGLWLSCFFATALMFIPAAIAYDQNLSIFPIWLTLFVFGYLLFQLMFFRKSDYLYGSFLCFFYVFLIVAPLLQVSQGIFPWVDFYTTEDIVTAWWMTALALLFFEIGYCAQKVIPFFKSVGKTKQNAPIISNSGGRLLFIFACMFTAFGLAFTGIDTLFLPRNQASLLIRESFGGNSPISLIVSSLMRVPPTIILLIFIFDFYKRLADSNRYGHWLTPNTLFMIITGLIVGTINNPISTARFWVGAIILSVTLLFIYATKRKTAFFWFSLNLAIITLAFPLSDIYRKSLDFNLLEDKVEINPTEELVTSPDFDAFQQQMNAAIVARDSGYQYGNQFISSVLFFVPRNIWPGKAEPTGKHIANELNYRFGNLSTPLPAEFYIDAGFIGIAFGMMVIGFIYQLVFKLSQNGTALAATFYCFFASYQFYLLRGSLMTVTNYLLVALVFTLGIYCIRHLIFSKETTQQISQPSYRRIYS